MWRGGWGGCCCVGRCEGDDGDDYDGNGGWKMRRGMPGAGEVCSIPGGNIRRRGRGDLTALSSDGTYEEASQIVNLYMKEALSGSYQSHRLANRAMLGESPSNVNSTQRLRTVTALRLLKASVQTNIHAL